MLRQNAPRLHRGLIFGGVTGVAGAVMWAIIWMTTGVDADLWLIGGIATIFVGIAGFIVGALGPRPMRQVQNNLHAGGRIASCLYRFVVGILVAVIVYCGVNITMAGLAMVVYGSLDEMLNQKVTPTILAGFFATMSGSLAGPVAAVFAALFAPAEFVAKRQRKTLRTSLLGGIAGAGIGIQYGALCGIALPRNEQAIIWALGGGIGLGLLAGVLVGLTARENRQMFRR